MTDQHPPAFPRVTQSPDESPTQPDSGKPLFSRFGADAEPVAPTTPVPEGTRTAAPSSMTMNSRWRWAVVGVATVLVVGLLGAVFVLAGPRAGTPSTVARYAPDNTAIYMELRLDLPGDQHNLLATFMSHFPGFADQAAFDQKLDESLNELVGQGGTGLDWVTDVKPWFGGQIGIFSTTINPTPGTPPSMTAALTVKDRAALDQLLGQWTGAADSTHEEYEGTTIWTTTFLPSAERVSYAATDEALLVGTRAEEIKDALDVRADRHAGLADDQFFLLQLGAMHADRLGTFYVDGRGMAEQLRSQLGQAFPGTTVFDWAIDAAAVRVLGEIRAESDHLAVTTRTERPSGADLPALPANRSTTLAEAAPKEALVYVEMRDVGQSVSFIIDKLLTAQPSGASGLPVDLSSLETLLGAPPQDFFDFIVDVSVSVSNSNGQLEAGLVATVDDSAIAGARVDKLLTALHALTQFGAGVTFDEQQHGDAKITVITVTGPMGEAGSISIAVSVTNGRLLIGSGNFVVNALDRTRDQSLATRPEYLAALQAGGTSNAGVAFVDIAGARAAVESMLPAEARGSYDANQRPFFAPFSHLAVVNTNDGGLMVNHVFLYVK